jgi:phosphoribosylaminoimidazole-succinocarboxamide synthase
MMPTMPDDFVRLVSDRYIELYETVTGQKFQKIETADIAARIEENVLNYLNS